MNIIIPMAGLGSRFSSAGYKEVKPLIDIVGRPMIKWAVDSLGIKGNYFFIIQKNEYLKNMLKSIYVGSKVIEINYLTQGPACTCLLAEEYINNDLPLVIANCDQIMSWDYSKFSNFLDSTLLDGVVVVYDSDTEKNSYIELDTNGNALRLAEKKVISRHALNGIHYWKHGSLFVESAKEMIKNKDMVNNEYYISVSYNYLIKRNKKVGIYSIIPEEHNAVGTPEDLDLFISKFNGNI